MKYNNVIVSLCALALVCLLSVGCGSDDRNVNTPNNVSLHILETSDVHGRLTEYNYQTGVVYDSGMVRVATIVKEERTLDPDLLLVDCGDITQGNLISSFRYEPVHPAIMTLNSLDYDIWEPGNHEFNYEFECLENCIANFNGTVVGGNIYTTEGKRFLAPYVIRNVKGVKVAVIGLESPLIPVYESDESHYNSMTFTPVEEELAKILEELQTQKPDVTIVLCHLGHNSEYDCPGMYDIGKQFADQVDAFIIGHQHTSVLKYCNDGNWEDNATDRTSTCLMEPGCFANQVGKLTLDLSKDTDGEWKVDSRQLQLLNCEDYEPDPELTALLQDYHEQSLAFSNEVIGQVSKDFHDDPMWAPGIPKEVMQEGPIVDLFHQVQLKYTDADISEASLFNAKSNLLAGDLRVKDVFAIYPYDNNTLYKLKVTGAQLKAIMERRCGRFFNQFHPGDEYVSLNSDMLLYEYDTFFGLGYNIDISKPVGQRIVNLTYKGNPVTDEQTFTLAINNYRYSQLKEEGFVTEEDVIGSSDSLGEDGQITSMITAYVREKKVIAPTEYANWKVIGYE